MTVDLAHVRRPLVSPTDRLCVRLVRAQRRPGGRIWAGIILRLLGVNIPPGVRVGTELRLPHATTGLVLHPSVQIGDRVTIFHGVTIGRSDVDNLAETFGGIVVEDDVVIGAGAVVLSRGARPLVVGRGSVIGANAVVTRSVGPGEVWAGNPARRVGARAS